MTECMGSGVRFPLSDICRINFFYPVTSQSKWGSKIATSLDVSVGVYPNDSAKLYMNTSRQANVPATVMYAGTLVALRKA